MKSLKQRIEDWKTYPNALGSESRVAIIVAEVAVMLGEDVPDAVNRALRTLSLRGTMRDIASAIQHDETHVPNPGVPSFHKVVDSGAASCGISWGEALAVISKYLHERAAKLGI